MIEQLRSDAVHRTALLSAHDGSQPTIRAALDAHARTGITICADATTCGDVAGQAALLTAVATAVRAFGTVFVAVDGPDEQLKSGPFCGVSLSHALTEIGAVPSDNDCPAWPVLLIGAQTPPPAPHPDAPVVRASWSGWTARIQAAGDRTEGALCDDTCVLAPIAAGALGVAEAFTFSRSLPGNDAGFRDVALDLWSLGRQVAAPAPLLRYAPCAWWLVGLGHLGQANAWAISWLPYRNPRDIEIILQDTDLTTPANHSTGLLTPANSDGMPKTRLVAAVLDRQSYRTRLVERPLTPHTIAAPTDSHVALIGVDNLPARRLISSIGWRTAIDAGLGAGPRDFSAIAIHRFPGAFPSTGVPAWADSTTLTVTVPDQPAFKDAESRLGRCGVVELAGKAVGAAYVGAIAACLTVAEAVRELHGGPGHDILTLDLVTHDARTASAETRANIVHAPLA
ncbi:hypothetical protein OHB01_12635 [Microbispora hainanensis]|uniref:hypothetical protein n=1 Tax=Microbispora hainanensis TaxID=568844 RepID=UPI002E2CA3FB|nr:hypothetical protein [Microbispora hainanensis]